MPDEVAIIKMLLQAKFIKTRRLPENMSFYQMVVKELVKFYGSQLKLANKLLDEGFGGSEKSIQSRISKYENGEQQPSVKRGKILEKLYHEKIKDDPIFAAVDNILNDKELQEIEEAKKRKEAEKKEKK